MNFFLKLNPKVYLINLLIVLAVIGVFQQGYRNVITQIFLAGSISIFLDAVFYYIKTKKIFLSSSAFITGMIIALILSPQTKPYIVIIASSIAIIQKHVIRYHGKHIFNPAMFGLLFVVFVFSRYLTWWGQSFTPLIVLIGLFISYRMRRLRLPLIFIGVFAFLFIINSLFTGEPLLSGFFLLNIFFVFVMLVEPKTAPLTRKGITAYAVLAALFSFIFFKTLPQYDFSLLALFCSNMLTPFLNKLT